MVYFDFINRSAVKTLLIYLYGSFYLAAKYCIKHRNSKIFQKYVFKLNLNPKKFDRFLELFKLSRLEY